MPAAETQHRTAEEARVLEEMLEEIRRGYKHRGGPVTVTATVTIGEKGIGSYEIGSKRKVTTKREPR